MLEPDRWGAAKIRQFGGAKSRRQRTKYISVHSSSASHDLTKIFDTKRCLCCIRVLTHRLYSLRERLCIIELTRRRTLNFRGAEQDAQQKIKMVHSELAMKKVSRAIKTSIPFSFRTYSSHERELIHTGAGKILRQAQLRGTRYLLSMFIMIHSFDVLTRDEKQLSQRSTRERKKLTRSARDLLAIFRPHTSNTRFCIPCHCVRKLYRLNLGCCYLVSCSVLCVLLCVMCARKLTRCEFKHDMSPTCDLTRWTAEK